MNREAVADQIVSYCDGLCDGLMAFSLVKLVNLVNGLAFPVALGEPATRSSIANIAGLASGAAVISPAAATLALCWLRRYELRLRQSLVDDELVSRFWRILVVSRFVPIWSLALVVLFGIWAATQDSSCLPSSG